MLDLKRLEGKTLVQGIQEQCLSGARKTATEIQNMIKSHQSEVLFLLDGYEVNKNLQLITIQWVNFQCDDSILKVSINVSILTVRFVQ